MFITIFDRIEQWILDYFDCPPDPNPDRVKFLWKYLFCLFIFCTILTILFYIYTKANQTKMLFIGVSFLLLSLILSKLNKKTKETQNHTIAWWHGEGKWYNLFIMRKK